jgi:hypothetical protein
MQLRTPTAHLPLLQLLVQALLQYDDIKARCRRR